jgi:hypothetical protein
VTGRQRNDHLALRLHRCENIGYYDKPNIRLLRQVGDFRLDFTGVADPHGLQRERERRCRSLQQFQIVTGLRRGFRVKRYRDQRRLWGELLEQF